ncbi:MAG: hypothetical protein FJZ01_22760 [Candidatus Sericytochromatia bacterium]|nr:hypothetical protein [Candidatus Tanganyikabacteria bacterium]
MSTRTWRSSTLTRTRMRPPRRRELDGVAHQVEEHLFDARAVHDEAHWRVRQRPVQPDARMAGLGRQARQHPGHDPAQVGIDPGNLERAGLEAGKIEHVVDDAAQAFGARLDLVHERRLLRREGASQLVFEELRVALDRGQRRPQLVGGGIEEVDLELLELLQALDLHVKQIAGPREFVALRAQGGQRALEVPVGIAQPRLGRRAPLDLGLLRPRLRHDQQGGRQRHDHLRQGGEQIPRDLLALAEGESGDPHDAPVESQRNGDQILDAPGPQPSRQPHFVAAAIRGAGDLDQYLLEDPPHELHAGRHLQHSPQIGARRPVMRPHLEAAAEFVPAQYQGARGVEHHADRAQRRGQEAGRQAVAPGRRLVGRGHDGREHGLLAQDLMRLRLAALLGVVQGRPAQHLGELPDRGRELRECGGGSRRVVQEHDDPGHGGPHAQRQQVQRPVGGAQGHALEEHRPAGAPAVLDAAPRGMVLEKPEQIGGIRAVQRRSGEVVAGMSLGSG